MGKLSVLIIVIALVLSAIPALAQDRASQPPQKSVFQLFADGFAGLTTDRSNIKEDATLLFQKSHDYINATFPGQKAKSLRNRPDDLAKRKGLIK